MKILFEDKSIIVCVKPVGVLSQEGGDKSMVSLIQEHLKTDAPVYVVHRLDRLTGGVMVYAKSNKAASDLSTQFANKTVEKEYLAVVKGEPEDADRLEDILFFDRSKNKSFVVKKERKGAKTAILTYEKLEQKEEFALIKIRLQTGRTHQIRVQFGSRKMPLLGDGKYGGTDNRCTLALWCHSLCFNHPITKERLCFTENPEKIFPYNIFSIK